MIYSVPLCESLSPYQKPSSKTSQSFPLAGKSRVLPIRVANQVDLEAMDSLDSDLLMPGDYYWDPLGGGSLMIPTQ